MGKTGRKKPSSQGDRLHAIGARTAKFERQKGKDIARSAVRGERTSPIRVRKASNHPITVRGKNKAFEK